MILFSPETGVMCSDIFGFDGSKELRSLGKKMRLDRVALRCEGDPVKEHYLVPAAKHQSLLGRGVAVIVSILELKERQDAKQAGVANAIAIRTGKFRPMTGIVVQDEAYHPPSYHSRQQDRRKNWRQEEIA